jgi:hypothetical protein
MTKETKKVNEEIVEQSAHALFGTDKDLESGSGVTIDFPGFSITIHRAGGSNKRYGKALAQKMQPHRQRFDRGVLDDATSEAILLEAFAEGVVIGWAGNIGPGGKKAPYSVENCIELLNELPDLYTLLKKEANDASLFRSETEEIEEKN